VADEVIQYALGLWGEEESAAMDTNIKDRILDRPRARELAEWKPPQPSLKKVREQLGGPSVSDDDLLLRYFSSQEDVAALKVAGPLKVRFFVKHPLVTLLESLTKQDHRRQIYMRTGEASIRLERRAVTPVAQGV
jgi:oxaloacetate decarboxylase (Na+ extruding) subunit alpha